MDKVITRLEVAKENRQERLVQYDDPNPESLWVLKGFNAEGICLVVSVLTDLNMDPKESDQFARDTGKMVEKVAQFIGECPDVDGKITLKFLEDNGDEVSIEDTPGNISDHRLSEILADVVPDDDLWDDHYLDCLRSVMEDIHDKLTPASPAP